MAVELGYKNVYRDPLGYPEWQAKGLPVDTSPAGLADAAAETEKAKPLQGWAIIWTLLGIFAARIALNLTPWFILSSRSLFPISAAKPVRVKEYC